MNIPIKTLHIAARWPTRANPGDAGYDLYALEDQPIHPGGRAVIRTGISLAIPEGYYGRIAPRSGLAVKKGIDVLAGVVDSTFRGEIGVVLINLGRDLFEVRTGDRIAQLIIERYHDVNWEVVDTLPESARAAGGFGSTGV